jgi:dipeptidyl aminopeptidase/acylaminoacyl peptidase
VQPGALTEKKKDVKYLELEGEGHGFHYIGNLAQYYQTLCAFLERVAPVE